ncbi:helix-turn-helix domain-containing protein [Streptomyces tailanensis]|uniref:helix-turn-helix domain-containing protein n=1 Tax=Streptomyces tailanensis TaxID=2569858 RepID=UPI00122DDBB2|nr:helix-turn-helix domain-containing protein [Streptomyces tailanensis]
MTTAEHHPVRPALASLRRARELFLRGHQLSDDVPEEVVAAWKRARFFGVRHDVRHEVRDVGHDARDAAPHVVRHSPHLAETVLLAAALPVLERLAPTLGTEGTALLLTDERLRVLWAAGGAPDDPCRFDLSEQVVGPNSAALALRTRRRAEVHGPEHFLDLWQDISAVSVPVLAPETGRTLGTMTVASGLCVECRPHPGASLAEAAAIAVEAELAARSRTAERVLLDAYLRAVQDQSARDGQAPGPRGRAVVALDGRNRLVSEAAGRLLSAEALEVLERGALALVEGAGDKVPPPRSGASADSYRVRLPDGAGSFATVTAVRQLGSVVGVITVLEPVERTAVTSAASVTSCMSGASAEADVEAADERDVATPTGRPEAVALAGRSVVWRHAVGRARELARTSEPLLLVGERGTGKTALARELAVNPLIVDAAMEGEVRPALDALTDRRTVLVRHAERLAQQDVAALNSLLEPHPGAPLLVTYTPGAPPGPCLQRLLDTLAARSVTLPALRERPEDIRELLTALAPRPTPGQPPLTWTLEALRALERHPWPGNVTELLHVVRALAEHRRTTGPVLRVELPNPVREGPAPRRLSPMEHAERAAILDALHRHGGNKARTAAALGIARATLYRKLRGYRD